MPALRKVVADLELVFASTELAGGLRREVVGEGKEDLGAEGLQQGPPGLAG